MKKLIKKSFIIVFIVAFHFSSIAAAVSDNDGSAFITKAEFDSLKSSFQSQLDSNNAHIDFKIDYAISTYLAGITVTQEPVNYWGKIKEITGGNLYWQSRISTGTENLTSQVNLAVTRELTEKYCRPQAYGWWNGNGSYRWDSTTKRVVTSGGTLYTPSNGMYWIRHFVNATNSSGTDIKYFDLIDFGGQFGGRISGYNGTSSTNHTWQIPNGTAWTGSFSASIPTETQTYYSSNFNASNGSGSRWEVHKSLNGKNILRNYYTSYYPVLCFTVWDHIYYDNSTIDSAFTSDGRSWKTAGTGEAPLLSSWGTKTNGNSKITKDSTNYTTSSNYVEVRGMINKISDGEDYSARMMSGEAINSQIYYSFDDANPYRVGTTYNNIETPEGTFYDLYHEPKGELLQTNTIAKYKLKYQNYNVSWTKDYVRGFYNEYVSQAVGEDVYVGQGVKLAESKDDKEKTYTIKLKFKKSTSYGNQVEYVLTNKKFNTDGTIPDGAKVFANEVVTIGDEITKEIVLDSKEQLWINMESSTYDLVSIDTFSIKMNS